MEPHGSATVLLDDPAEGCSRCRWGGRPDRPPAACRWCRAARAPEAAVVWLEPLDGLDYVRESVYDHFPFRRRRPSWRGHEGRLVGYAMLKREAPSVEPRCFPRRVFWLKPYDRDRKPRGVYRTGCPSEAVDPRTVAPNVAGQLTARAWWGAERPPDAVTARRLLREVFGDITDAEADGWARELG